MLYNILVTLRRCPLWIWEGTLPSTIL